MSQPFVPDSFHVPLELTAERFRLEPLESHHNERDHKAWMSSIDHIRSTPGFPKSISNWPSAMPLEKNLDDLNRHAEDFAIRQGFTYSVLDGDEVIGCVYIYPSDRDGFDAEISSWVIASQAEIDTLLWKTISEWLNEAWPFKNVFYESR